jgi:hypothetical protein
MKIYNELESLGFFEWLSETHNLSDTDMKPKYLDELPLNDIHRTVCNSMALRWFREKYKLLGTPQYFTGGFYCYTINDMKDTKKSNRLFTEFESFEEAELACISKLIEIVKQQTQNHEKRTFITNR